VSYQYLTRNVHHDDGKIQVNVEDWWHSQMLAPAVGAALRVVEEKNNHDKIHAAGERRLVRADIA